MKGLSSPMVRTCRVVLVFCCVAMLVLIWALQVGSSSVSLLKVLQRVFAGQTDSLDVRILLDLRLPRVFAAFGVGGLLGLAGLLMQVLLRNPLADPYILGVSGGAGLGGIALALSFPGVLAPWLLPAGAALGALLVMFLVFGLAGFYGTQTLAHLLLTGVAVSSLCTALVSLMLTFSDDGMFRGLVFWLLGELSGAHVHWLLAAWALVVMMALPLARVLNLVMLGDDLADSLGVSVHALRLGLYWLSALATGVAVSAGGMIGFVGLVVPHALRLWLGTDHRVLIPAVAVGGGVFLVAADCLARTVLAPVQLPVGVVTALAGAPVFIWLLCRNRKSHV